jgi:hypothetical protein
LPFAVLLVFMLVIPAPVRAAEPTEEDSPGFLDRVRSYRAGWLESTDAWLFTEPHTSYVNIQDTRMSPLLYPGYGFGLSLNDQVVRPDWLLSTAISGRYNIVSVPRELPGFYQNSFVELESVAHRNLPGRLSVGAGFRAGANSRVYDKLGNSGRNADIMVSGLAALRWQSPVEFRRRDAQIHLRGTSPVFSYVGRYPEYSLFGLASHWAPPWQFVRITVEAGLRMSMRWSSENALRLLYTWNFYSLDELDGLHTLRYGSHTVGLGLGLKRL